MKASFFITNQVEEKMKRLFKVFLVVFLILNPISYILAQEDEEIEISEIRVTYTRGEQDPRSSVAVRTRSAPR